MAELDTGFIVVIVLGSVLLVLLLVFVLTCVLLMRKKRLLCFRHSGYTRPFLHSERELQERGSRAGQKRRRKRKSGVHGKKTRNYQSLSKGLRFPKRDPFASKHLENPMVDMEELDTDWTNPAFDQIGAQQYDAVIAIQSWYRMIRVRVPFLQLKEATILAQAFYRGAKVRAMVPQLRREKAQRDQLRKKHAGWKKKGTLAALKYYDVKAFGFAEVEQLYGMETVRNAAHQLKNLYGGKGKMKLKLFISYKGIKLYHFQTMEHFATVKVATVSFCTLDPKNRKVFAFINRKKRRNFCHVFQASESDAQKMVETMAEAFEVTFRRREMKRKEKEKEEEVQAKEAMFRHKSQQLEDEVASMLEMAETASSGIAERLSEVSSEDGSLRGSRERLLASPERRSKPVRSSLATSSYRASTSSQPSQKGKEKQEEPFDMEKVDEYFTGIKEGVEEIAVSLEQESQDTEVVPGKRRLSGTISDMVERFS